jgi:transcriptional regulator GlxA family with amidase domain
MLLAAAGVLDDGPATTKREVVPPEMSPLEVMRTTYPQIEVREAMLVDRGGRLVTGGGVSLCIDTTLHLIANMLGQHVSDETARIMEYQRASRANRKGFAPYDANDPNRNLHRRD